MARKNHIKRSRSYIKRKEKENHFSDNTITFDGETVGLTFSPVPCPRRYSHDSAVKKLEKKKAKIFS